MVFTAGIQDSNEATEGLLNALNQYKVYLDKHSATVSAAHHLSVSEVQIDKTSLTSLSPCDTIADAYRLLNNAIENKPLYTPIFVQDFAPKDRFQRRRWLQNLKVPFNAMMYTYADRNSFGSLNFIWRVGNEVDQCQNSQVIVHLSSELPVFASRDVRRTFVQSYNRLSRTPKSVLRNISKSLTGDQTSALSS